MLAEAANSRLVDVEQQLVGHTHDAADHTQQLAQQARCTVKLGAELRQVKQTMQQLHQDVLQPLLRWQHEQHQQDSGAAGGAAARAGKEACDGRSSTSGRRKHQHTKHAAWTPPAAVTPDVVAAAAAAVEALLLQHSAQEQALQESQAAILLHNRQHKQRMQRQMSCAELEVQELCADLAAARDKARAAQQRAEDLQQQLAAESVQHSAAEQQHSHELAVATAAAQAAGESESQLLQLQQQVNALVSELACAQGEAAAAQRQVALLQQEQQAAAAEHAEQMQQVQQALEARWVGVCALKLHGVWMVVWACLGCQLRGIHTQQPQKKRQRLWSGCALLMSLHMVCEGNMCLTHAVSPHHTNTRLSAATESVRASGDQEQQRLQHMTALAAAQQEAQQTLEAAQQSWREQAAVLEKQHLQALLRARSAQEQERQQWQRERDELVQQLTAQYTASGVRVRTWGLRVLIFQCWWQLGVRVFMSVGLFISSAEGACLSIVAARC